MYDELKPEVKALLPHIEKLEELTDEQGNQIDVLDNKLDIENNANKPFPEKLKNQIKFFHNMQVKKFLKNPENENLKKSLVKSSIQFADEIQAWAEEGNEPSNTNNMNTDTTPAGGTTPPATPPVTPAATTDAPPASTTTPPADPPVTPDPKKEEDLIDYIMG